MNAWLLSINFHLGGCRSLKEKRQRLKGIRDRYGRPANVAVCESDFQDSHQRAQWTFIATSQGDIRIDFVGRFERLQADCARTT